MLNSSKQMMKYQFDLNKKLADENRNWQESMANSAHQREIADLKAAGLNPVLSVTGGSGATTPSGSTASVSDGAGYASALANLEAARINSATQMYMHTTPGANTLFGQIGYAMDLLGLPLDEVLGAVGNWTGMGDSSKSIADRLFFDNKLMYGLATGPLFTTMRDRLSSASSLKSLNKKDIEDFISGYQASEKKKLVSYGKGLRSEANYRKSHNTDKALFGVLSALYPEEYKNSYGSYPFKGLEKNRRLKRAKR